jgi:hypothetical protein
MEAKIKEFFKRYPKAPGLLQVGDKLYLTCHADAAKQDARLQGVEVIDVPNPKAKKK